MLTSLRIQNFRSIRDASVKLGQVNLFIGPNNSGKSNFLKGIEFLAEVARNYPEKYNKKLFNFPSLLLRTKEYIPPEIRSVNFSLAFTIKNVEDLHFSVDDRGIVCQLSSNLEEIIKAPLPYDDKSLYPEAESSMRLLSHISRYIYVYKPDPAKFIMSSAINTEHLVSADASNLISFIFNLSQNYKSRFRQLEDDLKECIGDLVSISTPADPEGTGKLKLKFFDQNDVGYWAEEVSEGVLYFLALLCIIHQPDPPKLLLLEEPEKGIHPRRIKEVMDFIFELARLRDIQIILTSHSPYVVDHFADIPECISVFDRVDGETVIHNAADIIAETNAKLSKPIRYSDALGEHWVSGFLGGVPV